MLVSTALSLGDIKYLILMLEICIMTVMVKGHVYCWKYHKLVHKLVQYFQTLHRNEDIQLFQKTLSGEKQKVFKPRPQGNVGCFKSVFCWQTITPLNWSLIFIRHLYWTILIILVFKKAQGKITFQLLIPIFESNFLALISKEKWH